MKTSSARRWGTAGLMLALLVGGGGSSHAGPSTGCSTRALPGGDWPSYGHDAANTRTQPSESTINPAAAKHLVRAWSFSTGRDSGFTALNLSEFNSSPVAAGGCVYVASGYARPTGTTTGDNVYAFDAISGHKMWSAYAAAAPASVGGAIVGAPLASGRELLVLVNQEGDGAKKGPYVIAYDRRDGHRMWTSDPLVTVKGYYTNASLALGPDGVLVAGFSAPEGDPLGHGGIRLLDVRSGDLLGPPTYSIPQSEWYLPDGKSARYGGGGVWTAPAVDLDSGYAYYGTGNPFSKQMAHPRTDAILKVDLDRSRVTFGHVVGSYTGNIEQYVSGVGDGLQKATKDTTCALVPDNPASGVPTLDPREGFLQAGLNDSATCGQLDLDFGAGPNLFTDDHGREVVGDLQKSGVYHAVFTDGMTDYTVAKDGTPVPATTTNAWRSDLGKSCQFCNGSSSAYDPSRGQVYAAVSPGTFMAAVQAHDPAPSANRNPVWLSPIGDGVHYSPVSVADGVVYTVDNTGCLDAFDAKDGTPLLHASLTAQLITTTGGSDRGTDAGGYSSGGLSIADHMVFVEAGSHLVAFHVAP